jgi:hypothetical protein
MFDYVSAHEIKLLRKLRARSSELYLTSDQRIRLELLGLITDGPKGIQLTAKGLHAADVGCGDEQQGDFEPLIVSWPTDGTLLKVSVKKRE